MLISSVIVRLLLGVINIREQPKNEFIRHELSIWWKVICKVNSIILLCYEYFAVHLAILATLPKWIVIIPSMTIKTRIWYEIFQNNSTKNSNR
jgi:hypothetical protein